MNLRNIPSVNKILINKKITNLRINKVILKDIINKDLADLRKNAHKKNNVISEKQIIDNIVQNVETLKNLKFNKVINGTGVLLHTNLGRSPISKKAIKNIETLVTDYSDLELNISNKKRNKRTERISNLLTILTGAESGTVVNNNAMALLCSLAPLGKNKEILISRSESVEIGGGFRIPEIIELSGLTIKDVGTTNKTYISDYEKNINANTAAILKVHKSNYKIKGFTEEVSMRELSKIGNKANIPIIHDLGSGALINTSQFGLPEEKTVSESVKEGATITLFSGDKLLGGPQAGIIVGEKKYIEKINNFPLSRAARIDKLNLSILHQTLLYYISGEYEEEIPFWSMLRKTQKELFERAKFIEKKINGNFFKSSKNIKSTIGGGTFPDTYIDSAGIVLNNKKIIREIESFLLEQEIPIIGRIEKDILIFDLRTIIEDNDEYFIEKINMFFKK
ncbi:MAG: L-seryl-tRNA(Sec) selenium transferase [Chloroflexi bacterium]|nr:L-seryl-tRNA(Sec) selenium transferase [Chloroflexota bacterium]